MFQGNNVKNQNWDNAMFADLGSSPASMEAGRLVDAFGMRKGYTIQQSDAVQAYLQAKIRGKPTWAIIPQDQWPEAWKGMKKPVCRLNVALYGHPDSGTDWEHHCKVSVNAAGFSAVGGECWPSCFYHKELDLLLSVYVDDFKLAGPVENIEKGWALIAQHVELDPPQQLNLYLGCIHRQRTVTNKGKSYTMMEYNMEDFMRSCVKLYRELFPKAPVFRDVSTPCWPEDHNNAEAAKVVDNGGDVTALGGDVTADETNAEVADAETEPKQFHTEAARVIMKIMYGARMARPDLLRTVSYLARFLTKWNEDTDKRLQRLMSYIHHSYSYRMYAYMGEDQPKFTLDIYSDSDYAGCVQTQRSTTGSVIFLRGGEDTSVPISFMSKRQGSVSRSTPEAEIVAMDMTIRILTLPVLCLVEEIFPESF